MSQKVGSIKINKAIQVLIVFILSIYPLMLFRLDLGNFYMQELILFLGTIAVLFYCFLRLRKGDWKLKKGMDRLDFCALLLTGYAFFKILGKILGSAETVRFDFELTVLALAGLYILIQNQTVYKAWYFDVTILSGLLVFVLLLVYYLLTDKVGGILTVLIQDKQGIASYAMLICTLALWQYCRCKEKIRSYFYVGVLSVGFFVLFINKNIVSIWLMCFIFLGLPLVQRTTAELVKRDMQMFFLYLFLLSNMSLLVNYTEVIRVEVSYNLEQSVYLELVIALGGAVFFYYWDKVPEGADLKRLVLRKLRRVYKFVFAGLGICAVGILLGGTRWNELSGSIGMEAIKGLTIPLVTETWQERSGFFSAFEKLGILGGGLLLVCSIFFIERLKKRWSFDKPVTSMLIIISFLYLVQLLFWDISIVTVPLYGTYMILAVSYQERREKVSSKKVKYEDIPVKEIAMVIAGGEEA